MSAQQSEDPLNAHSGLNDPRLLGEWFAVAWSREVQPGQLLARRLLGRDVVLWRAADGIHCWRDLCIHRGAQLSLGKVCGERLICPYHAWEYGTNGQCVHIPSQRGQPPPAKARAQTYHARERYGIVWVCVGEPQASLPQFAVADDPAYRLILSGPYFFKAKGPRVIENFLDVAPSGLCAMRGCWATRNMARLRITKWAWVLMARMRAPFASGNRTRTVPAREPSSPTTTGYADR